MDFREQKRLPTLYPKDRNIVIPKGQKYRAFGKARSLTSPRLKPGVLRLFLVMPSSNASVGLPRTPGDFVAAALLRIQYHGRLDIVRPIFEVHDGVQASTVPMSVFVK